MKENKYMVTRIFKNLGVYVTLFYNKKNVLFGKKNIFIQVYQL